MNTNKIASWIVGSKVIAVILVLSFFYVVTAASHYGFFNKWALRDGHEKMGFKVMMEGTAYRPYVYRQLVPLLSKGASTILPQEVQTFIAERVLLLDAYGDTVELEERSGSEFHYGFLFLASFCGLFLSLVLLRKLLLELGFNPLESLLAPAVFALLYPYVETIGGYYYDSVEIVFFCAAVLLASRGWSVALVLLALPATMNKESFFFFLFTLYPFLRLRLSRKISALTVAGGVLVAGGVNVAMKYIYADNPGSPLMFHLVRNIKYYLNPFSYFRGEVTYGVYSPRGVSFLFLLGIISLVAYGWRSFDDTMKRHAYIAAVVNLPLYFLFCYTGELRNLSMLYLVFVFLIAGTLRRINTPAAGHVERRA